MEQQKCTLCGVIKDIDQFGFRDRKNNVRRRDCKVCEAKRKKKYYSIQENHQHKLEQDRKYAETNREKLRVQSYKRYADGNEEYREKKRKYQRERYKNSLEIRQHVKSYHEEYNKRPGVKERQREVRQLYYSNPENRKKHLESAKRRFESCPLAKLTRSVRNLFGNFVRAKNLTKNSSTFKLLGYTPEELYEHLESQFQPDMTWDNYGFYGWHIDHIKPVNTFNVTSMTCEDFKKCWALSSLRPLWAKDNWSRPKDGSDLKEVEEKKEIKGEE